MRRLFSLISAVLVPLTAVAEDDMTLVENGRSDYQIVIPNNPGDNGYWRLIEQSARRLRECVRAASGAELPIREESMATVSQPGIYIGHTRKAASVGLPPSNAMEWRHQLKVSGKDLILIGNDRPSPALKSQKSGGYSYYELGSVKAVALFLEKFCATRFIIPGPNGIVTQKLATIAIPSKLDLDITPPFRYCIGRTSGDMFYDIANNFLCSARLFSYGGHSHPAAIPQDKYFKSNPEYFALIKGKRQTHPERPQYCLSNPQVQAMIYQEIIRKLDEGYECVELAQSDGFRLCECEECKKLYNTSDFSEKLWIMHRDMAVRLLRDRPGKKVMIISYFPTVKPPKSFKDFPENVIIQLCKHSPSELAAWEGCRVPGGFTAYVYNWGSYHVEGFTPKCTPEFCREQVERFHKHRIWGVYRCGFGELFGLEGRNYYTYGKLLASPSADPKTLADEYLRFAFPSSLPQMSEFFTILDERLNASPNDESGTDWADSGMLDGKLPDLSSGIQLLITRYSPKIASKMEALLEQAAGMSISSGELAKIALVRKEFDYLKVTAAVAWNFGSYRNNLDSACLGELLDVIDRRNQYISDLELAGDGKRIAGISGCRLFEAAPVQQLQMGGKLLGILKTPFDWNTSRIRQLKITPGNTEIRAVRINAGELEDGMPADRVWQKAPTQSLEDVYMRGSVKVPKTAIRLAHDSRFLYVRLSVTGNITVRPSDTIFQIFIGTRPDQRDAMMFACRINHKTASAYRHQSSGNSEAPHRYITASDKVDSVWTTSDDGATQNVTVKIPLMPLPDGSHTYHANFFWRSGTETLIWEPNINWKTWRNRFDSTGRIILE